MAEPELELEPEMEMELGLVSVLQLQVEVDALTQLLQQPVWHCWSSVSDRHMGKQSLRKGRRKMLRGYRIPRHRSALQICELYQLCHRTAAVLTDYVLDNDFDGPQWHVTARNFICCPRSPLVRGYQLQKMFDSREQLHSIQFVVR
jgi:hypothetical protein